MTVPSPLADLSETAHEMAYRLGISDEHPEAFNQFDINNEAHIFSTETLPPPGTGPWFSLMCEFSSLYLPRLIQSILSLLLTSSPLAPPFLLQALGPLLPLPFAATYIRTHPEETRKLVLAQMEYIAGFEIKAVTSDEPYHLSPSSTLFESHTRVLHNLLFLSTLCSVAEEAFFVPSYTLRFNTIASLRAHQRRLSLPPPNDPKVREDDTEEQSIKRVIAFIQEDRPCRQSCVGSGWEARENKESKGLTRGWPWDGCAMRHAAGCVAGAGKELMACAKCRSVRYCSPVHQRAHWKLAHSKHQCFQLPLGHGHERGW